MDETARQAQSELNREGRQLLTFALGAEEYGIDVLKVQEIRAYAAITPIPNAPPYVRGVINLRGAIVPIFDLRARFGLATAEYTKFTVIIVIRVAAKVVGLVVDAVSDVLHVTTAQIEPPPELGAGGGESFMTGIAKVQEKLIQLVELERLVGVGEQGAARLAQGA